MQENFHPHCKHISLLRVIAGILLSINLLSACSDTDPKSRNTSPSQLLGLIDIYVDTQTNTVDVSGRVSDESLQDIEQQPNTLADDFGLIRLVDGDAFFIDWEGVSYQLYRRSRDFIYQTDFATPVARDLIVRLFFKSSEAQQQSSLPVQLPDIRSLQLLQTGQNVLSSSNLDLSWNLNLETLSTLGSVDGIETLTQPGNCFDASGLPVAINDLQAVSSTFSADINAMALTLPAAEILQPLTAQGLMVNTCTVTIQLQVRMTFLRSEENQAALQTSVVIRSPVESVTILDAAATGFSITNPGENQ